jgi:hypothetical protein
MPVDHRRAVDVRLEWIGVRDELCVQRSSQTDGDDDHQGDGGADRHWIVRDLGEGDAPGARRPS